MLGQGKGVRTAMSDPFLRPEDPELYSDRGLLRHLRPPPPIAVVPAISSKHY